MPKDIYVLLSKRVRDRRKRAGLSIEKLAELVGVSAGFLAHIETNLSKPSIETVGKIADALHVPVADLFRDVPVSLGDADYALAQQVAALLRRKSATQKATILNTVRTLAKNL